MSHVNEWRSGSPTRNFGFVSALRVTFRTIIVCFGGLSGPSPYEMMRSLGSNVAYTMRHRPVNFFVLSR